MHSVTIKISSEFPIKDTSSDGIRQLLRGIGDGRRGWAGSVEVVDHTGKCTCDGNCGCDAEPVKRLALETTPEQTFSIVDRLQALLRDRAARVEPTVRSELNSVLDLIEPVMTYSDVALVRVALQGVRHVAIAHTWGALSCELASIEESLIVVQRTLATCEV